MNFANAQRKRLDIEARRKAHEAGAATGEPRVSAFDLEVARREYFGDFEIARAVRDGIAQERLTVDQRTARVRELIEGTQLARLVYEHKRTLFVAQQRAATEKSNTRLAFTNLVFTAIVMLAILGQVVAAVCQYKLTKWQADHPALPVVCSH